MIAATTPPNIVVIFADDMGYGDVGAYNPKAKTSTPRIDRLARAGIRFSDGHVSAAVCTPSRYGLLTGRYAWRTSLKHGVLRAWDPLLISENCDTLASLLKRHGYTTAVVGKWHLGLGGNGNMMTKFSAAPAGLRPGPNERGFDYSFIIPASANMAPISYLKNLQPINGIDGTPSPSIAQWTMSTGNGSYPVAEGYDAGPVAPGIDPYFDAHPDAKPRYNKVLPRLSDEAVDYVTTRTPGVPFFLYLALPSPHTPWVPDIDPTGLSDEELYLAYVKDTDSAVGRLIDALKRSGKWENTLVVFSSDNGPELRPFNVHRSGHDPAGGLRGEKSDLYEGGHCVPFIVTWPGHIPEGTVSDQLVSTLDLYKTFATLVGDEIPSGMVGGEDSYDISALLRGQPVETAPRPELVLHSSLGRFGLRMGNWAYLDWPGSGGYLMPDENEEGTPVQLFDLSRDPGQRHNIYTVHPERVAQMKAALIRIQDPGVEN